MLKKELKSHYLVTLVWLIVVSLLRLVVRSGLIFTGSELRNLLFFWLGGLAGTFLLDIDHLLYTLVIYPQELTSLRVRRLLGQHHYREMFTLLVDTHEERYRLSFHNALFQPVFYVFCFWVLTSTGTWFGKALVMTMALHLLKDEISLLFKKREEFLKHWLFWQVKREVSLGEQKVFVIIMLLIFLGLNLLLV